MTPVVVPQARERVRPLSIAGGVCALVCVAVLPALLFSGYSLDVVTEIMIFAIAALSLNLILGYGGMVSFGHAALFGLSAYATVIVSMRFEVSPWIGLACGVLASTVAAAAIGAFCVRLGGVGFFMMSLAFAQLLNSAAVKWRPVTGGSDGVGGLLRPFLFGFDLTEPTAMYVFTLMSLLAALLATWRIVTSPFGHALVGTRESSHRMSAIGYDTQRIRLVGFVLSGALAGLSGGLYAFFNGFVSPDALSFGMSGMILLMVVLGGKGSLVGPVVGAALFLLVKNVISSHTSHWLLIVGSIFVACVMFCPDGIMGLLRRRPPPETR